MALVCCDKGVTVRSEVCIARAFYWLFGLSYINFITAAYRTGHQHSYTANLVQLYLNTLCLHMPLAGSGARTRGAGLEHTRHCWNCCHCCAHAGGMPPPMPAIMYAPGTIM